MAARLALNLALVLTAGVSGCRDDNELKATLGKLAEKDKVIAEQSSRMAELEAKLLSTRAKEISTLPMSYVVANGIDAQQIAQSLVHSTIPIFHSIGEQRVRVGRVTLLGREGDHFVGFTTSCAVTLNHPWPERVPQSEKVNQIIAIKPPGYQFDYYMTDESVIAEDKGVALSKTMSLAPERLDPVIVTVNAKDSWKPVIKVAEGDYVEIFADEGTEGEPQVWSVSSSWGNCGPSGYPGRRTYTLSDKYLSGCLLVGQSTGNSPPTPIKGYDKGGIGFFARSSGQLELVINDRDLYNNSGSLRVEIRINRGVGKTFLKKIREAGDKVRIKTFARNDVALVYFPINKGNYFGDNKPEAITTLGVEEPTQTVQQLIAKATDLFGHKFMLYCERCDEEICRVPELEEKAFERGYQAGFKHGKEEGVRVFVSSFIRPLMGLATTLLTGGVPIGIGGGVKKVLGKAFTRLIGDALEGEQGLAEYLRPSLQRLAPELNGILSSVQEVVSLAELSPRVLVSDDIKEIRNGEIRLGDGTALTFAGLKFPEGDTNLVAVSRILKQSSQLLFIPQRKKAGKLAGHFFDGHKYVNQLAIASGLAGVDKAETALPLIRDLLRFEEQLRQ